MVRLTKNSIIIEIKHVSPSDVLFDLKEALLFAMQNQDRSTMEIEKLHDAYYFLLMLLGAMLVEENKLKKKK